MKKILKTIYATCLLLIMIFQYAAAKDNVPEDKDFLYTIAPVQKQVKSNQIRLLSETISLRMDYSALDNVFEVEVLNASTLKGISDGDADGMVLFMADFNEDDVLIDVKKIDNVTYKTAMDTTGSYQKAFLFYGESLKPVCTCIDTKCDYEIVEGIEGEWETIDNGHTLSLYKGKEKNVVIPNSYAGKRIYNLQNSKALTAYKSIFDGQNESIETVSISEGIRVIGHYAFYKCTALCEFPVLPESVTIIGGVAFGDCSNMQGTPNISSIQSMYMGAFYNCSSLTGSLTLPQLQTIPNLAFYNCSGLTGELLIPSSVTQIGNFAFGISSGTGAFTSLTFEFPSELSYIGHTAFQRQVNMQNELVLPDTVEHIGDFAFNHCSGFTNTSLTLPSSLKTLGGDSKSDTNTGYGCHVFYNAFKSAVSFEIDDSNEYFSSIGGVLYSKDKTRLAAYPPAKEDLEFTIPEGVTQIDEMAFAYSKIKSVTLPDSYVISENVPENVINNMANTLAAAFYHNNSLEAVNVKHTNTYYSSEGGILYSKDLRQLWYVPTKYSGIVTVLSGTDKIMKGAFYIEYISGGEAYSGVYIPASVTEIDEESLKSINLRPLQSITVHEDNTVYTVKEGKITYKDSV